MEPVLTVTYRKDIAVSLLRDLGWQTREQKCTEPITMNTFCEHHHIWAGSPTTNTTYWDPPYTCTVSWDQLTTSDFCRHDHKFAANWTTYLDGPAPATNFCADKTIPDTAVVTRGLYRSHYHLNASSPTIGPVLSD